MRCKKYCPCTQSKCDGCDTCKELNIVRRELKGKYEELYKITESYVKRLHISEDENKELKQKLARIQRLPHIDKVRASAVIMQVAAQLAKIPEIKKAKQLQEAVDQWTTYTSKVEAERDEAKALLNTICHETNTCMYHVGLERKIKLQVYQECLQFVDWHSGAADNIREVISKIKKEKDK